DGGPVRLELRPEVPIQLQQHPLDHRLLDDGAGAPDPSAPAHALDLRAGDGPRPQCAGSDLLRGGLRGRRGLVVPARPEDVPDGRWPLVPVPLSAGALGGRDGARDLPRPDLRPGLDRRTATPAPPPDGRRGLARLRRAALAEPLRRSLALV